MITLRAGLIALGALLSATNWVACTSSASETSPLFHSETPRAAGEFVDSIGVNTHINYFDTSYGNSSHLRQELGSLGIRHVRDGAVLQNDDYNKAVYGVWRSISGLGVRFDMCFDPRGSIKVVTPDIIKRLLLLSGSSVESIEGPNELDLSKLPDWPEVTRSYQHQIFSAAHQLPEASHLSLIGPSMAFVMAGQQVGRLSELVRYGNLHSYPAGGPPSQMLEAQIAGALAMYPGKQIVITETGYHNAVAGRNEQPAVSEAVAAKYIPRLLMETFNRGIVRTYLYEFEDEFPDPAGKEQERHWGLLRNDGSEKPAFVALRNLIATLADDGTHSPEKSITPLKYALRGDTASIHHTLLLKRNGHYYLALWQEVPSVDVTRREDLAVPTKVVEIRLTHPARRLRVYDSLRGTAAVVNRGSQSSIFVAVPDHVVLVEIQPN